MRVTKHFVATTVVVAIGMSAGSALAIDLHAGAESKYAAQKAATTTQSAPTVPGFGSGCSVEANRGTAQVSITAN